MASHLTFIMSISSGIIYWPLLGSYLSRFFVDAGPLQVVVLLSLSFCRDTDSCITPRFGSFQTAVSLPDRWSFPDSCLTLVCFRDTNSLCPTLVCFRCTNHFQTVVSLPDLVIAKQMSRSQIWPFPNNCLTPRFGHFQITVSLPDIGPFQTAFSLPSVFEILTLSKQLSHSQILALSRQLSLSRLF